MRATSTTFRSLRHRNARLFFFGLLVSSVGTWMQLIAMQLLVYRLTGEALSLGVTVALQFLPMLLLGAWAGAVADRHDKRRLTLLTQSALAVQAVALGVLDLAGHASLPVVYVFSFLLGLINAMDNPARRGFVTELVEPDQIGNAMSLNTAVMTGSRIFGPAIAAVLVGPLGTGWLFVLNGVSYAAILVALLAIDPRELHRTPLAPRGGTPVRDALRYIRGEPRLLAAFVAFAVVSTFAFNYSVTLPKLADERWGGEEWFGWLLAVISVGSLAGSLVAASRHRITLRFMALNGIVLGVSGLVLAWAPGIVSAMALAVPLGLGGAGFIAAMNAISQNECPPAMRGRILALISVAFLGSTPIGGPITGWVADHVGPEWSLAYGSLISLVAVLGLIGWAIERRGGRRIDRDDRAGDDRVDLARLDTPSGAPPAPVEHP